MAISTKKIIDTKGTFKENLLTPRFYTTNFKEMSELDISSNREEIEAIVEEFRIDYNRDHFIRDKEFLTSWDFFDEKTRDIFIEFLERSCTAEFSGFLLYKEISRNLKKENPLLAEGFSYMSRDEARHAGFLNKAMSDFNISLDLGFLT
jgi:magnesium-protoporphyrin IX monomethyl ester (oxidative) cyclase